MSFQINPEISKASTLPKEFYLDNKYFNFCLENIFPHSWQLVADKEMFNHNNNVLSKVRKHTSVNYYNAILKKELNVCAIFIIIVKSK